MHTHVVLNLENCHPLQQVCVTAALAVKNSKFSSFQLPADGNRASNAHVHTHLADVCVRGQWQGLNAVDVGLSDGLSLFLSHHAQCLILKLRELSVLRRVLYKVLEQDSTVGREGADHPGGSVVVFLGVFRHPLHASVVNLRVKSTIGAA